MPESDKTYLSRVISALVGVFPGGKKRGTVWVAVLMLLVGFVVRPFLEGFAKRVGEGVATQIIPEKLQPRLVDLEPSKIGTATYRVALLNRTKDISDSEVERVARALQKQVHEHLAPIWGVDAQISSIKRSEAPTPGHWWLELLDESDTEGALGYHDVTPDGLPKAKVFVKLIKQFGESWSLTASHELLDMLVDPRVNLLTFTHGDNEVRAYWLEIATPTQADSYSIDGVTVSNFVFPAWFESQRKADSAQFDYLRLMHKPLEIRPGGYAGTIGPNLKDGYKILFSK